jgi:hypothetical protein
MGDLRPVVASILAATGAGGTVGPARYADRLAFAFTVLVLEGF